MKKPKKFYSRRTGRMQSHMEKGEKLSTAELADLLRNKDKARASSSQCALCKGFKAKEYAFCKDCYYKAKDMMLVREVEEAKKKSQIQAKKIPYVRPVDPKKVLAAKKRQAVIFNQARKTKTILYQSINPIIENEEVTSGEREVRRESPFCRYCGVEKINRTYAYCAKCSELRQALADESELPHF